MACSSKMSYVILVALLVFYVQLAYSVRSSDIVNGARRHIGSDTWSFASRYGTGRNTNKCNQFVYDVLDAAGARPPRRRWWGYSPIGAGEWGNERSSYLRSSRCWNVCSGSRTTGDVISDGRHVGIITGTRRTTSSTSERVVENDWGFRASGSGSSRSITACWRFNYNGC